MKTLNLTWSKSQYLKLMAKEYLFGAFGRPKEAYRVRYERDAMIPRSTPGYLLDHIVEFLRDQMTVLDVACGDGELLDRLGTKSVRAFGMDFSLTRVYRAVSAGRNVVLGDMHSLPFRPKHFDLVIASRILQQTGSPEQAIGQWKEVLKDDGALVIMLSDIQAARRKWSHSAGERWKVLGYRSQFRTVYERQRLIDLLESTGLEIERFLELDSSGSAGEWIAICRKTAKDVA